MPRDTFTKKRSVKINDCRELELICAYLCINYPIITFCGYDDDDDCCDEEKDYADDRVDTDRDMMVINDALLILCFINVLQMQVI